MEVIMKNTNDAKYQRAQKRVKEIKSFYIHLGVYVIINAFILANFFIQSGFDQMRFWDWTNFSTLFFWGIGLAFHGIRVFGIFPIFGSNWEERKIQEYMDRDRAEKDKYL
ncbi:2TM domain-containing protein [Flavobacterium sp. ASW18X]|nr:2TM domain-containing protein [Flavobacterium sp. ASW18X]